MSSTGTAARKRQERFHGAFTGGFSAGFYNSVGSAEGWTPSTFTSSRDKRAAPREQRPEDFMDDEDGLLTEQLHAKQDFDTLGSTAAEVARKHSEKESIGGAIPGPAPSELIIPVGDPMGKKLLRTMGWREGQGVGSRVRKRRRRFANSAGDESYNEDLPEHLRAGLGDKAKALLEKAGLTFAPRNTNIHAQSIVARTNLSGVGHDPFKDAPEFGSAHAARGGSGGPRDVYRTEDLVESAPNTDGGAVGPRSVMSRGSHGFVLDDGEDDVYDGGGGKEAYDLTLEADGGDFAPHDSLASGTKAWASAGLEADVEATLISRRHARCSSDGRLPPAGFVVARKPDSRTQHWAPPVPPADFKPFHTLEAEEAAEAPILLKNRAGTRTALNSQGRARLLGEPSSRVANDLRSADSVGVPGNPASVFSLLSPSARRQLLDAANGVRAPASSSSTEASGLSAAGAGGGGFARPANGVLQQEASNARDEGHAREGGLASRFTSEKSVTTLVGSDTALTTGRVDPALRAAGLSFRTPNGSPNLLRSSATQLTRNREGSNSERKPLRTTLPWKPSPLLCKRLNVPARSASTELNGESKERGRGRKDLPTPGDPLGLSRKFVPDSSVASQTKVPLLYSLEQQNQHDIPEELEASIPAARINEDPFVERPPIDLFKSIFESESESESESEEETDSKNERGDDASTTNQATSSKAASLFAREQEIEKSSPERERDHDSSEDSSRRERGDRKLGLTGSRSSPAGVLPLQHRTEEKKDRRKERHSEKNGSTSMDRDAEFDSGQKRSGKHKRKREGKSSRKEKHRKHHKRKRSK